MNAKLLYVVHTSVGPFYIGEKDGRFHPIYKDESLGSYERADQAAEDLAGVIRLRPHAAIRQTLESQAT